MSARRHSFDEVYDLVIVGTGVAGLITALHAANEGAHVAVLSKTTMSDTNTARAQGGVAGAIDPADSPSQHAWDTVRCAAGVGNQQAAEALTSEAVDCVQYLDQLGVGWDRENGVLVLAREGGHSFARVVHSGGDATGVSLQRTLVNAVSARGVSVLEYHYVTSLLTESGICVGVEAMENGVRRRIGGLATLLATGGAGMLYSRTTNPSVATGDGLALAYRAGAELIDLEFFQFHPTALAIPGLDAKLLSEAVRGAGGILRNQQGHRFMERYHADRELAPRDVVSRAIWQEMRSSGSEFVYMDVTGIPRAELQERFPTLWNTSRTSHLDPARDWIPIAPAAHYFMGGIRTDLDGRTTMPGLFAVGEVAATGVHGANRLASNSLLEGMVFGNRAARAIEASPVSKPIGLGKGEPVDEYLDTSEPPFNREPFDLALLPAANWEYAGVIRSTGGLSRLRNWLPDPEADLASGRLSSPAEMEASNLALISALACRSALARCESRGAHYRSDFPETSEQWRGHIIQSGRGMRFDAQPRKSEAGGTIAELVHAG